MSRRPELDDDPARRAGIRAVEEEVAGRGLHTIRLSFADQHGLLRGTSVSAAALEGTWSTGVGVPSSLLAKDTGQTYALPLWQPTGVDTLTRLTGAKDVVLVADPTTFRVLPWVEGTGWLLCDLTDGEGRPLTLSTREILRDALVRLARHGYTYRSGLELELHLYRPALGGGGGGDRGYEVSHPGWDLRGEASLDLVEPLLEPLRSGLGALGLPPRSLEVELGPAQVELTFDPVDGLAGADQAVLVRSAVKQLARRAGIHATFMCRPGVGSAFPSGWHLHQSLVDPAGANAFLPGKPDRLVSEVGEHVVGGLLSHAASACLLTTPTVNGYKRYRPRSVAPDRIGWSVQHRGAMLRVVGDAARGMTHLENRVGDPAANPYLYLASQVLAALDGLTHHTTAPPAVDDPYAPTAGPLLPRSLGEAIAAFEASSFWRGVLGDEVADYVLALKRSEWNRFLAAVTDWEQQEYFEQF